VELELALMQSICTFKSSVLGDPRILLLGNQAKEEHNIKDQDIEANPGHPLSPYAKASSETRDSYNSVAQMLDNTDMQSIMTIFAEKMLTNLVYSRHDEDDSKRIITCTLEVFSFYCGALST